jgi:hypothetical protein
MADSAYLVEAGPASFIIGGQCFDLKASERIADLLRGLLR